jgi:hypothetical protein
MGMDNLCREKKRLLIKCFVRGYLSRFLSPFAVLPISLAIETEPNGGDEPSSLAQGSGLDIPKALVFALEYL